MNAKLKQTVEALIVSAPSVQLWVRAGAAAQYNFNVLGIETEPMHYTSQARQGIDALPYARHEYSDSLIVLVRTDVGHKLSEPIEK